MKPWRVLRSVLRGVFLAVAALVLWIEEWGWQPLVAFAARIDRWPPLARIEDRIRRAPPRVALVLFLVPAAALFPLKLGALWLLHEGWRATGIGVIVAAKLIGTAFVGRLFVLAEPQLMQFAWLARALFWWRATKLRVKLAIQASAPWRAARRIKRWAQWRFRRLARRWR